MKSTGKEPAGEAGAHAGTVSRFFLLSTALGLLIGLFEAYLLWTRPRVIPLLAPDVSYVIWFLAPLVDMIFFALVGLGLGWLARLAVRKELLVAVAAGISITFVGLIFLWFHFQIALNPFHYQELGYPFAILSLGVSFSLLVVERLPGSFTARFEGWMPRLRKPLAWALSLVTVAMVAGIGIFAARPSFSGASVQAASRPSGAPNIVFITLDTVRADHVSAYGYSRPTTPNLDRFARTGVLFENAIAPTSWTLSSHASMFTGLLPQQHGADFGIPLSSDPWTLAKILRSRGYETAGFVANNCYLDAGWGIAQGFETYDDYRFSIANNLSQTLVGNAIIQPLYQNFWSFDWFNRRNAADLNRQIFEWFRHRSERPFFLFVNYYDNHDPYVAPPPYARRFGKPSMGLIQKFHQDVVVEKRNSVLTPQDRDSVIAAYDNCLAYDDDQLHRLLSFLSKSTQWKNTIVIVTSDHGEGFGGHGTYEHGEDLYRQVLHVPLIIAGPGVPAGLRISHLVAVRQLFSTVLDLAARGSSPFSGSSLARFWKPGYKPTAFDNQVVSELVPIFGPNTGVPLISLTTPQWQYIEHRNGRQELYNWSSDPKEKDNLAPSPQEQATLERLHSRLVELVSDATGPWRGQEFLKALGSVAGSTRVSLLFPKPLEPGDPDQHRIGMAQAFFKQEEPSPIRPSQSERDLMKSLPYQ